MPVLSERASAKINLTLEILGRRPDGYHELVSLVAFAPDAADDLTLTPGPGISLVTDGPEAATLDGENLISKVAAAALAANPGLTIGAFHLTKRLPVASGIGGGSADAAAALRLIARINAIDDPEAAFSALAAPIGADIPVCLGAGGRRAAFMSGIGERVWRPAEAGLLPAGGIPAVLVNPRVGVATGPVFTALAAAPLDDAPKAALSAPAPFSNTAELVAYLDDHPNDLEPPARRIAPVIGEVLDALTALPGARAARMSGSGATCFAIFDDHAGADAARANLAARHREWWAVATFLH